MRRFRDAITGRFTRRSSAEATPDTTVAETVSDAPEVEGALRWRIGTLEAVMLEEAGSLRIWARDRGLDGIEPLQRIIKRLEYTAHDHWPAEDV